MKVDDYKKSLLKRYDAFSMEFNPDKRKLLQLEIHNILNNIEHLVSEDFYIWGLSYYSVNEKTVVDSDRNHALEKFLEAYRLDVDNFLACLYIAHCYQDKNDLLNALDYYEKVDQEKLKDFQIWRYVKLIEQIGYCHFKLGRKEIGRTKFKEVLAWYKKQESEELAFPTELIDCLDESDEIVKEIKEIEGN